MSESKVFNKLGKIPISDFYGQNPEEIKANLGFNEAVRYLTDLVLVNDMNKSKFYMVSEKSSESNSKHSGSI